MEINVDAASKALDELIARDHPPRRSTDVSAIVPRKVNVPESGHASQKQTAKTEVGSDASTTRGNSGRYLASQAVKKTSVRVKPEKTTTVAAFLEQSKGLRVLECKPVEASGTGATTVFLRDTQTSTGVKLTSVALPFKAWMTKTSICPEPYVVFEVRTEELHRYQRHVDTLGARRNAPVNPPALVVVSVLFEQWVGVNNRKEFEVRLASAADTESSVFHTHATATLSPPKEIVHLEVPAESLSKFAKVDIRARTPGTWLVKVSGICVWLRSDRDGDGSKTHSLSEHNSFDLGRNCESDLSASAVSLAKQSSANEGELPDQQQAVETRTLSSSPSPAKVSSKASTTAGVTFEVEDRHHLFDGMDESRERDHRSDTDAEHKQFLAAEHVQAVIAVEMKEKAKLLLHHFAELHPKRQQSSSSQDRKIHHQSGYNWMKDEIESVVSSEGSAASHVSFTSSEAHLMKEQENAAAFARLVDDWDTVQEDSVKRVLTIVMENSANFTYFLSSSTDTRGMAAAVTSARPFNLLSLHVDETRPFTGEGRGAFDAANPLEQLLLLREVSCSHGYEMRLLYRVPQGFCVSVGNNPSIYGEAVSQEKFIMVVVEDTDDRSLAFQQSTDVHFSGRPHQFARLIMIVDITCSFSRVLPCLARWVTRGDVQYYGPENQSTLTQFFVRSCAAGGVVPVRSICYGGFQLCASRVLVGEEMDEPERFISLSMHHCPPKYLIGQFRQPSPRVVLTNAHILEHLHCISGGVVPREMMKLATSLFNGRGELAANVGQKLLVMSNEPWRELARRAHSTQPSGDSQTWFEARRRATTRFAFHALSAAFRRDWRVVGICIPHVCCLEERNSLALANGFLDSDALMDTFFHWSFSRPAVVVLFYGHSQWKWRTDVEEALSFPPFSCEELALLRPVADLQAALE